MRPRDARNQLRQQQLAIFFSTNLLPQLCLPRFFLRAWGECGVLLTVGGHLHLRGICTAPVVTLKPLKLETFALA